MSILENIRLDGNRIFRLATRIDYEVGQEGNKQSFYLHQGDTTANAIPRNGTEREIGEGSLMLSRFSCVSLSGKNFSGSVIGDRIVVKARGRKVHRRKSSTMSMYFMLLTSSYVGNRPLRRFVSMSTS